MDKNTLLPLEEEIALLERAVDILKTGNLRQGLSMVGADGSGKLLKFDFDMDIVESVLERAKERLDTIKTSMVE